MRGHNAANEETRRSLYRFCAHSLHCERVRRLIGCEEVVSVFFGAELRGSVRRFCTDTSSVFCRFCFAFVGNALSSVVVDFER